MPLPFGFPVPRSRTQSQNGKLHFAQPQFATLHSVTTLAFPYPIRGMSCDNGYPGKPKAPKFSKRPNGVSEIKEYGRAGEHVLDNAGFEA